MVPLVDFGNRLIDGAGSGSMEHPLGEFAEGLVQAFRVVHEDSQDCPLHLFIGRHRFVGDHVIGILSFVFHGII